jgi:hypothetical protein
MQADKPKRPKGRVAEYGVKKIYEKHFMTPEAHEIIKEMRHEIELKAMELRDAKNHH